jgi:hypothetical protein
LSLKNVLLLHVVLFNFTTAFHIDIFFFLTENFAVVVQVFSISAVLTSGWEILRINIELTSVVTLVIDPSMHVNVRISSNWTTCIHVHRVCELLLKLLELMMMNSFHYTSISRIWISKSLRRIRLRVYIHNLIDNIWLLK